VDREGEHPAEPRERGRSPPTPRFQHDLGVARGMKLNARLFELGAQRLKIVDLAVIDEAILVRSVPERLVAARIQIEDRQARVRKADAVASVRALGVRTAMTQQLSGSAQLLFIGNAARLMKQNSKDATHESFKSDECCESPLTVTLLRSALEVTSTFGECTANGSPLRNCSRPADAGKARNTANR